MLYYLPYHTLQRYFSPLNVSVTSPCEPCTRVFTAIFWLWFSPSLAHPASPELQIGQFFAGGSPGA